MKWLESIARKDIDLTVDEQSAQLKFTIHALKSKDNSQDNIVSQVDPDAPVRQGKKLHSTDEVYYFFLNIFIS